jgi:hypothetical protein
MHANLNLNAQDHPPPCNVWSHALIIYFLQGRGGDRGPGGRGGRGRGRESGTNITDERALVCLICLFFPDRS